MERKMATVSLRDKIASLPKGEQKAIAERAEVLKAEVRTLRELRKAQDITQVQLAHEMGVTQETVSRMEKRGNMLVATLSKTIQKLGGELVIMAKFPRLGTVRVDLGDGLLVSNEEAVRV